MYLFSSLALVVVELLAILSYSRNKSFKTYLRPMLPPGGRNWQMICPNFLECYFKMQLRIYPIVGRTFIFNFFQCNLYFSKLVCLTEKM
jgi:hypothetical protein